MWPHWILIHIMYMLQFPWPHPSENALRMTSNLSYCTSSIMKFVISELNLINLCWTSVNPPMAFVFNPAIHYSFSSISIQKISFVFQTRMNRSTVMHMRSIRYTITFSTNKNSKYYKLRYCACSILLQISVLVGSYVILSKDFT